LQYEVIGDGQASAFFKVNRQDGMVTVADDLNKGSDIYYTVSIMYIK
jgi:hypothetical protein